MTEELEKRGLVGTSAKGPRVPDVVQSYHWLFVMMTQAD